MIYVEILRCHHCPTRVLAVTNDPEAGSTRINYHKCAGQWDIVDTIKLQRGEAENMIEELQNLIDGEEL